MSTSNKNDFFTSCSPILAFFGTAHVAGRTKTFLRQIQMPTSYLDART